MPYEIRDAICVGETEKAILVDSPEFFDEPEWIPKSQLEDDSEVYEKGDEGTLIITDWLADKLNLENGGEL